MKIGGTYSARARPAERTLVVGAGGYAGVMVMFVVAGLAIVGVMLAPNLVLKVKARARLAEEQRLTRIGDGLVEAIERWQMIPSETNWAATVAHVLGMDDTEVAQVYPAFAADANTSRVYLMDPGLTAGVLPYSQGVTGLTGSQTNLLGSYARVLLVSNTKRSLTLPVSSGTPSSNDFYGIWNWVFDPVSKAPPSGWPASWTGKGEFLHVKRINLANEFHNITFENLMYGLGGTNTATNLVTTQTTFQFLRGTWLTLAKLDNTYKRSHIVNRDIGFDLSDDGREVLAWYEFSQTNVTLATNSGTLGSSADVIHTNGVTLGVAGPRPPTFTGFSSTNMAISLDGSDDYVKGTTNGLMDNWTAFTIAGWINPSSSPIKNFDLFGQLDIAEFSFSVVSGQLKFAIEGGLVPLLYNYPYGTGEWHHIAGVADGDFMKLYVDGVEVRSMADPEIPGRETSDEPFNIGAKVTGTGNYFEGLIDDVVVYDRALSAAEVVRLYDGDVF